MGEGAETSLREIKRDQTFTSANTQQNSELNKPYLTRSGCYLPFSFFFLLVWAYFAEQLSSFSSPLTPTSNNGNATSLINPANSSTRDTGGLRDTSVLSLWNSSMRLAKKKERTEWCTEVKRICSGKVFFSFLITLFRFCMRTITKYPRM